MICNLYGEKFSENEHCKKKVTKLKEKILLKVRFIQLDKTFWSLF